MEWNCIFNLLLFFVSEISMAISRKELTASVIMKIFGKIVDSAMLLAETLLELWRKRPTFVKGKKAE